MGANSSQLNTVENHSERKVYEGFSNQPSGSPVINEKSFKSKFHEALQSVVDLIWNDSKNNVDLLTLDRYDELINNLCCGRNKIIVFVKLFNSTELNEPDIRQFFSWVTLGRHLRNETWDVIFKSFVPRPNESGHYSADEFIRVLNRKCPDVCEDLARVLLQHFKDCRFELDKIYDNVKFGELLNFDILWLLSNVLNQPYKRVMRTCLLNSIPLEIEQLSHLLCLYTSFGHGHSSTRIMEKAFDYTKPIIMLISVQQYLFALAIDVGLKESWNPFGGESSVLFQIYPEFIKLVSGPSGDGGGIIYANFSAKTARRGLLVGHQPLSSPVIEISDGFDELRYHAGPPMRLNAVEIWAAGTSDELLKLNELKEWEAKQVLKAKERKIKADDWKDSADRQLLSMAGVQVRHSDMIEPS